MVKEGTRITKRIQVWYDDPSKNDIPPRELSGLQKTLQGHEKAESILLTNDYEDVLEIDDTIIRCIPVVKYLLGLY